MDNLKNIIDYLLINMPDPFPRHKVKEIKNQEEQLYEKWENASNNRNGDLCGDNALVLSFQE